ncbi:MAG: hypothetical protein A2751_00555 [Candidatus Doudnabacteria bacterium RIFCSPHIGHO2_01_FULL_46_14]|uniref:Nmd3 N-terminal domain-containing protein n=1 Tax=Candidatus Doudnabacteria bacterium RIFCSPHIGHO2_01_FULL_46_14 TaxID=1817824 RepID=A0A1F5NJC5_9BACT|nr:MAG: hypothetical protein A2751_00555 [Candidatus Doudnabacteria bacterium RIFCSPHIGHO2_01_FULL_46_14]
MNSQSNKIALKTGAINRRHQRSRKEESEFGKAGKEFIICPECDSVFFDKAWHHRLEEEKNAHLKIDRKIKFELCPACKMARDKLFEGELVISIKNKELSVKNNVLNTVKNSDKQARERDPMDRILRTEEKADGIHVFTSENQLAVRIGKKLKSSFGGSKLQIKHGGEDITRVYIEI